MVAKEEPAGQTATGGTEGLVDMLKKSESLQIEKARLEAERDQLVRRLEALEKEKATWEARRTQLRGELDEARAKAGPGAEGTDIVDGALCMSLGPAVLMQDGKPKQDVLPMTVVRALGPIQNGRFRAEYKGAIYEASAEDFLPEPSLTAHLARRMADLQAVDSVLAKTLEQVPAGDEARRAPVLERREVQQLRIKRLQTAMEEIRKAFESARTPAKPGP